MNQEEIRNNIVNKVKPHIESLGYEPNDFFVAGGCIASMINDEEVSDYDVYVKSESLAKVLGISFDTRNENVASKTNNAITFKNQIQYILKFVGEPQEIINSFDFVHTMSYYDFKTDQLVMTQEIEETIKSKTLTYTGSDYAVSTLIRIPKYIKRGWNIYPSEHMKIIMDVNINYDLNDKDVLVEQLMGVDLGVFFTESGEIDLSWKG